MSDTKISDYAFLSDCQSSALVDRDGSIDWYCPQRFDAASIFARLLDPSGGSWKIHPAIAYSSDRSYADGTLVLETIFYTVNGSVRLTDALVFEPGSRGHEIGLRVPHTLVRRVEGLTGTVQMTMLCAPRVENALTYPRAIAIKTGVRFAGGPLNIYLQTTCPLHIDDASAVAEFRVEAGNVVDFALVCRSAFAADTDVPSPKDGGVAIKDTIAGWLSWASDHPPLNGPYANLIRHSSVVLQGLTYQPTGAIIAAATTSLPESEGGSDNWDYRFAWLRDLSLTLRALYVAACPTEAERYFDWIAQVLGGDVAAGRSVQIMFGVAGERDITERTLEHLKGFGGSAPVRVGNAAWQQKQLDVFGEIIDAIYLFRDTLPEIAAPVLQLMIGLADQAANHWQEPDSGMWEARDRERQYLSSKVMCWVALDRAIKLAPRLGPGANVPRWEQAREDVRQAILERGWNAKVGAYTGAFESDQLDASVLLMPLVDFLPATDLRMQATIDVIMRELASDGQVHRWKGDQNGFFICTYWLVECLVRIGKLTQARALFDKTTSYANDLGLLTEMVDPRTGTLWGNVPQAFSHVGLINAAWSITQASEEAK